MGDMLEVHADVHRANVRVLASAGDVNINLTDTPQVFLRADDIFVRSAGSLRIEPTGQSLCAVSPFIYGQNASDNLTLCQDEACHGAERSLLQSLFSKA